MQEQWNEHISVNAMLRQRRELERSERATKMVILNTIAFYLCWLPFAIQSILTVAGFTAPLVVTILAILCAEAGPVAHPIIYIWFNREVNIFL